MKTLKLVSSLSREFLDHWQSLRSGEALPSTEHYFDHADPRFMSFLLMFECAADDVTLRFQGTGIVERWARDRTAESWLAGKPAHRREAILANMTDCMNTPCGAISHSTYISKLGRSAKLETLTLPLSVNAGRPGRLISYSNLLEPMSERDGGPGRIEKRELAWIDVGFGRPVHGPRLQAQ